MADPVDNDKEAQDAGNILLDGLEGIIEALGCFLFSLVDGDNSEE